LPAGVVVFTAAGWYATVPGGYSNQALGNSSFAVGNQAIAYNQGCFVWGDSTNAPVACGGDNGWVARASGGVWFYTNSSLTSGVVAYAGSNSWSGVSDRAVKENFTPADGQAILEKLASLPIQEYNLKSQDGSIRHIGLVAQDFATLGYGESDKTINMQDADGVAMASIQALYAENQNLTAENEALRAENAAQQTQIDAMEARLTALEQAVAGGKPAPAEGRLPVPWLLAGGLVVAGGSAVTGLRRRTVRRQSPTRRGVGRSLPQRKPGGER